MQHLYGIVSTDDDRYVMAAMTADEGGTWKLGKLTEWEHHAFSRVLLLFHRGVYYGITSWFKPRESTVVDDSLTPADYDTIEKDADAAAPPALSVVTNTTVLDAHREALSPNLLGMLSEDAFLATVPLCMHEKCGDSFVTVFGNGTCYRIGITENGTLTAVFRMAPGGHEKLPGHLGRIERFWHSRFPDKVFPEKILALGDPEFSPKTAFEKPVQRVQGVPREEHTLKAMGCALAQKKKVLPLFVGETPGAAFRKKRTILYGLSAATLLVSIMLLIAMVGMNAWYTGKKTAYENEYQRVIGNNKEIKKLLKRSNELAGTITRLENTLSRQTIWGKFFYTVGKERPEGLFFERFGTEPIPDEEQTVRVAISGWTAQETKVTDFIARLQEMPYVTHITLSSLERNKKRKSIFGFKVLCTLLLNEQ